MRSCSCFSTLALLLTVGCLVGKSLAGQSVDVLRGNLGSSIQEEEILRVLAQNKTGAASENFTLIELIGAVGAGRYNDTGSPIDEEILNHWTIDSRTTNPYYGECVIFK